MARASRLVRLVGRLLAKPRELDGGPSGPLLFDDLVERLRQEPDRLKLIEQTSDAIETKFVVSDE